MTVPRTTVFRAFPFDCDDLMCHIVHMKEITIRELHLKTGAWVRRVAREGRVVVKERGQPVATLVPFELEHRGTPFSKRVLVPGFADLPPTTGDSTDYISEDRERV